LIKELDFPPAGITFPDEVFRRISLLVELVPIIPFVSSN
jgi:hypothetical protein